MCFHFLLGREVLLFLNSHMIQTADLLQLLLPPLHGSCRGNKLTVYCISNVFR